MIELIIIIRREKNSLLSISDRMIKRLDAIRAIIRPINSVFLLNPILGITPATCNIY